MKYLIFALLLCSIAQAKEFKFAFYYPYGTKLNQTQYKTDAKDWEEAYKRASNWCAKEYSSKMKLNDSTILGIIDACANPRH